MAKYTEKERQEALDWLKAKIRPRLQHQKSYRQITEEQLDSITIAEDKLNMHRINYLLPIVWENWVSGWDYLSEWNYRLLEPLDEPIIAMDECCDCNDLQEGDPSFFELYCKLVNNSEAIKDATSFIEVYEHLNVHVTIRKLHSKVLYYRWKYEPETLNEFEKRFADSHFKSDASWVFNESHTNFFPKDDGEVD